MSRVVRWSVLAAVVIGAWAGRVGWSQTASASPPPLILDEQRAYPRPSIVPTRWELEFDAGALRIYVDPQTEQPYWYFTYTVTNRTDNDQVWAPRFTLFTDAGNIMVSGRDVPRRVVENLMMLLNNPFLEDQNEIIGEIYQGREHAREGLVLWPAENLDVTDVTLFIAGISGETARVTHPQTGDEIILRKTLQRDYEVPGMIVPRRFNEAELVDQQWILR